MGDWILVKNNPLPTKVITHSNVAKFSFVVRYNVSCLLPMRFITSNSNCCHFFLKIFWDFVADEGHVTSFAQCCCDKKFNFSRNRTFNKHNLQLYDK